MSDLPPGPALSRDDEARVAEQERAVLAGDRVAVARAITLVESTRPDHRARAQALLARLAPRTGGEVRVGVSGVPGVGKSTFIDALGARLTAAGHRVAVLAVDPSSTRTRGSILGDKTRMARLAVDPAALVRPSPSAGTLGGVARSTREAMVVVAAAGYDVVLVETVGVGQSEAAVADMTDTFLLLSLARTGDQLQGIKKGVLELADVVAVNKADGPHADDARRAARELAGALRLVQDRAAPWNTPVLTCSALTDDGLDDVWRAVLGHRAVLSRDGGLARQRAEQQVRWMWDLVREGLLARLRTDAGLRDAAPALEQQVREAATTPVLAAEELTRLLLGAGPPRPE